ncbi:hypothetical protein [Geminocystis sp. NIES-3709]|nr:hypothetical protein [Geminocystis sp. NIES-3709]
MNKKSICALFTYYYNPPVVVAPVAPVYAPPVYVYCTPSSDCLLSISI